MILDNKTILITGGTGSFGQKFTEILLKKYNPKVVRIYSRDEYKHHRMSIKFSNHSKIRFLVGDVRDKDRLERAMEGVDIVINAAALKQVPIIESNPLEAIKTNIIGAANVIDAALNKNVEKVIQLSTDKAVNPVNLYGATKLCAEKIFIQANSYSGKRKTRFSCTRYGNVVGSRGSVIPVFLEQKKNGALTITDKKMTRFWITLEEGVDFVIKSLEMMKGGEIFVPKIPSMKILDLADVLAPGAKHKIIGIRPGEKIHELLLGSDEARHAVELKDFFVILPENVFWAKSSFAKGKKLPDGFFYSSDKNSRWITKNVLKKIVEEVEI